MKVLLLSAFLFVIGSGLGFAQEAAAGETFLQFDDTTDLRSSELVGATVYVTDTAVTATAVDGLPEGWESVATIDDLVVTRDGMIRGALVDVGGFLGIGARTVMVSMDSLRLVERSDDTGVFVVFTATREQLEAAPEYDVHRDAEMRDTRETIVTTRDGQPGRVGVREPAPGFERADWTTLTADDLTGAAVYDRFDERVSGISDVVLSADGTSVEAVLIDVGGFLGIGARTVAVDIDQIEILHDATRNDVRVYLAMTQEQLENLPEYRR